SIESLYVSRDLIPFTKSNLAFLKSFIIRDFCDEGLSAKFQEHSWQADQILPNVKFYGCLDQKSIDLVGMKPRNLPSLEWLECSLDEKNKVLDIISGFESLTALSLGNTRNQDLFEVMKNKLKVLNLEILTRGFPLWKIADQTNLEILRINGYAGLNMEWLLDLSLKEIQLFNCSNVTNAETLLEMMQLESLTVVSCRKALSKELKLKLKERELHFLDIDYSG
ncbi:MAG: hypothetical protein FWG53_08015, partial [Clostridiales bacterium]|nr:hypothetical protein [Clostridiales bacterium]